MMCTILVTGGAGYIGSHTVKYLRRRGYRCVVVDNLVHGHVESVGEKDFYRVDCNDASGLDRVFQESAIDAVIHFAAYAYVGESVRDPKKYYHNNVSGTITLLDCMLHHGVTDMVFSSSCATYGNPQYVPIDESHPQNPINPYGLTKLFAEKMLPDYNRAYGLNYVALRYFNAAGCDPDGELGEVHDPETHLIPLALKAAKGDIPKLSIYGDDYDTPDGTCIRDYVHVVDLASAHCLAMEHLSNGGESVCLNLGVGTGVSVREIVSVAERVAGRKVPLEHAPRRMGDPAVLYADARTAADLLGWKVRYGDINEIIETSWAWFGKR